MDRNLYLLTRLIDSLNDTALRAGDRMADPSCDRQFIAEELLYAVQNAVRNTRLSIPSV